MNQAQRIISYLNRQFHITADRAYLQAIGLICKADPQKALAPKRKIKKGGNTSVSQEFGLEDENPDMTYDGYVSCLAGLNDSKLTFAEIADLIEEKYL